MKYFSQILLIFLLVFVVSTQEGAATIEGALEWGYMNFDGRSDAGDVDASHFTQRYSLMYKDQRLLAGGRAGYYDLGIGAEWAAFDSSFNDMDISQDSLKILYEGRIAFAPGALPFRLDAYSYDLQKIYFDKSNSFSQFNPQAVSTYQFPFRPNLVTDLNNGQTIVSGIQFMAGIRNGSYLGAHRELLSQWPRVLIDYRDVLRKDTHRAAPQHYRDRNLAFISLNKKDNWFHYRIHEFSDYVNPDNDWNEKSLMLGTIDHLEKRHWINLTNWIKLSVDGEYSETYTNSDNATTETYVLNLFTQMNRNGLSAVEFANLERKTRGGYIGKQLDIPVFVNKIVDPDTSAHSRFNLWKRSQENGSLIKSDESTYYGKVLLKTQKSRRVQYDSSLEAEVYDSLINESRAVRGELEIRTNPLLRGKRSWFGRGSLALFEGTDRLDRDTLLWETDLTAGGDYKWRPNVRVGAVQRVLYGQGKYGTLGNRYMSSRIARGFANDSPLDFSSEPISVLRTYTTLYLESKFSRWFNRFEFYNKFEDKDGETRNALRLTHDLRYRTGKWKLHVRNMFLSGDDVDYSLPNTTYIGWVNDAAPYSQQFKHRTSVTYTPSRYWSTSLDARIIYGKGENGDSLLFLARQEAVRRFYGLTSVRRKIGDITQALEYEQSLNGIDRRAVVFSLYGNYRPMRHWRIGAGFKYNHYDFYDDLLTCSFTTGVDFPLFSLNFSYQYGVTDEQSKVAHRYEVNMKKTF